MKGLSTKPTQPVQGVEKHQHAPEHLDQNSMQALIKPGLREGQSTTTARARINVASSRWLAVSTKTAGSSQQTGAVRTGSIAQLRREWQGSMTDFPNREQRITRKPCTNTNESAYTEAKYNWTSSQTNPAEAVQASANKLILCSLRDTFNDHRRALQQQGSLQNTR